MPRNNNAKLVSSWFENSEEIQLRKPYTLQQLHSIFKHETNYNAEIVNTVTLISFKRHVTFCMSLNLKKRRIVKIEEKYRGSVKYILLSPQEKSFDECCFRVNDSKQIIPKKLKSILTPTPKRRSIRIQKITSTPSKLPHEVPNPDGLQSTPNETANNDDTPSKTPNDTPSTQNKNIINHQARVKTTVRMKRARGPERARGGQHP